MEDKNLQSSFGEEQHVELFSTKPLIYIGCINAVGFINMHLVYDCILRILTV